MKSWNNACKIKEGQVLQGPDVINVVRYFLAAFLSSWHKDNINDVIKTFEFHYAPPRYCHSEIYLIWPLNLKRPIASDTTLPMHLLFLHFLYRDSILLILCTVLKNTIIPIFWRVTQVQLQFQRTSTGQLWFQLLWK